MARNLRHKGPSADAELAVGALERPDPLDLPELDLAPTALGLDEAEGLEVCSSPRCKRPVADVCTACGSPLCRDCISQARKLANPAG